MLPSSSSADVGEDKGGQSRSGGSDGQVVQSSESVEDRSRDPTRDVGPSPSGGTALSRAPGDSEVSCEEGQAKSDYENSPELDPAPPAVAGRRPRPRDTAPPAVAGEVSQGRRLREVQS